MSDRDLESSLVDAVIDTVPQWSRRPIGATSAEIVTKRTRFEFSSMGPITVPLAEVIRYVEAEFRSWQLLARRTSPRVTREQVQDRIALFWLKRHSPWVQWEELIDYLYSASQRTFENNAVGMILVLTKSRGVSSLRDKAVEKLLDPIASSGRTILRLSGDLRLVSYRESGERQSNEPVARLLPDFLRDVVCGLLPEEVVIQLRTSGDIVVADKEGLVATYRKRHWHIYAIGSLLRALGGIFRSPPVARALLDVALDVSYRPHGTLLVYDPGGLVIDHVSNPQSLISRGPRVSSTLQDLLAGISATGDEEGASSWRSRRGCLAELASLDGAVVVDRLGILGIGSMIESHPRSAVVAGSRTMAAFSTVFWGGVAIKVSSDGEITVVYPERASGEIGSVRSIEFL